MNSEREDLKPERKRFKSFQFRFNEGLGDSKCYYAYRWVFVCPLFSIRLHKWIRSDDKRYMHNHPYNLLIFILKGNYTDVSINQAGEIVKDKLKFGSIRYRPANHTHYVDVPKTGAISLVVTSKPFQKWGFLVNGKIKSAMKYFHKFGHGICDEQ